MRPAVTIDLDALVRDADRRLDIIDDADAEQSPAPLRLPATDGKAVPVGRFQNAREVAGEVAAVVGETGRSAAGQSLHQVATAQLHTVDPQPPRCYVDQPLHDSGRLRPAGTAKRRGRHRIGHHARSRTQAIGTS